MRTLADRAIEHIVHQLVRLATGHLVGLHELSRFLKEPMVAFHAIGRDFRSEAGLHPRGDARLESRSGSMRGQHIGRLVHSPSVHCNLDAGSVEGPLNTQRFDQLTQVTWHVQGEQVLNHHAAVNTVERPAVAVGLSTFGAATASKIAQCQQDPGFDVAQGFISCSIVLGLGFHIPCFRDAFSVVPDRADDELKDVSDGWFIHN
ncbi:MAG: hypothetical protein V4718_04180 [Pseudomonadota bacterium]